MCKMAHFGNCDPETADQEYCIFHKIDKSEEEAEEFYNKFVLKFFGYKLPWNRGWVFAGPLDASGFVFPRIGGEFTFENAIFESMALFDKVVFEGRADFRNSKFNGFSRYFTSFNETIFNETALFSEARFSEVYFTRTLFRGPAYFKNGVFEYFSFVDVIFNEIARFDNAKFIGKLYRIDNTRLRFLKPNLTQGSEYYKRRFKAEFMKSVSFKDVSSSVIIDFSQSKFHEHVSYNNAHFIYGLECHYCEFNGTVTGYFAKFQTYTPFILKLNIKDPHPYFETLSTSFTHSVFKETAMFIGAEFGKVFFNFATFEKGASFKNSEFHGNVHFEDVEFKKTVEFQSAKFERDAIFNGSTFEKRLIFVEEDISTEPKPKFRGKLEFSNCDFRQGVRFVTVPASNTENAVKKIERQLKELFDPNSPSYSYSLQEAARIQRLSFEKEGKRDEADQMFVIEMRARRKIRMREAIASGRTWSKFKARLYNFLEWLLGDLFSNYGTGWARLLYMGLGIPLGLFPLVYALSQYQYLGINLGFVLTLLIFSFLIGAFTSQSFDIEPERESRKNLIIHSAGIFGILWTIFSLLTTLNPQGSICIPAANSMCKPIEMFSINDIFNILYYSMVTFTTLGYGDMHPTGWLKALSAMEALTGAVFMALIVAVIARKWMR